LFGLVAVLAFVGSLVAADLQQPVDAGREEGADEWCGVVDPGGAVECGGDDIGACRRGRLSDVIC
jgi:hypothetical protein